MKTHSARAAARRAATDEKITAAVLDIIRSNGVRAVTIDAVTARSGVAKTTIYRRYQDRFELLAGVLEQLAPMPASPEVALTRQGLAGMLRDMQVAFTDRVGLASLTQVLSSDDEFVCQWREKVVSPRLDGLRDYLSRGVAEGVFDPDVDHELLVQMLIGGMAICYALRGECPDDWADGIAATIWPLLRTAPTAAPQPLPDHVRR